MIHKSVKHERFVVQQQSVMLRWAVCDELFLLQLLVLHVQRQSDATAVPGTCCVCNAYIQHLVPGSSGRWCFAGLLWCLLLLLLSAVQQQQVGAACCTTAPRWAAAAVCQVPGPGQQQQQQAVAGGASLGCRYPYNTHDDTNQARDSDDSRS